MLLLFGADHGGFHLKQALLEKARSAGFETEDLGATILDPADDYPVMAGAVSSRLTDLLVAGVAPDQVVGVLICRSSGGVTIAANRVVGVRAVACRSLAEAKHARSNNHANILTLAGDHLSEQEGWEILQAFLEEPWSTESRHLRRVQMLDQKAGKIFQR